MAAISLRGYWRTLIVFIACNPAMRMTKLTTIASTGRLMNRSVKDFIAVLFSQHHESTGVGFTCGLGARSLLITTGMPLRNLKRRCSQPVRSF